MLLVSRISDQNLLISHILVWFQQFKFRNSGWIPSNPGAFPGLVSSSALFTSFMVNGWWAGIVWRWVLSCCLIYTAPLSLTWSLGTAIRSVDTSGGPREGDILKSKSPLSTLFYACLVNECYLRICGVLKSSIELFYFIIPSWDVFLSVPTV